ncbi:MAG: hypothetical protein KME43_05575 [Myxacorys chilensis ATA2-1-KO14]|nr:hypothetical protein [Myxacorys chilensis ATA2-1-KO14]
MLDECNPRCERSLFLSLRLIEERHLFVSLAAVNWHAHPIYGKLEVNHWTQAVAKARELGLYPNRTRKFQDLFFRLVNPRCDRATLD